jgi:hypothetical protein
MTKKKEQKNIIMVARNSKLLFVIGFLFIVYTTTTQAQTLIKENSRTKEIETNWKMEWGILTGMGVSNVLRPDKEPTISMPEGINTYRVMYAARPEAEIGFFGEIGKTKSFFSLQAHCSYTMRAVPEPVFYNYSNSNIKEVYKSTYLNGGTFGLLFCFKPVEKFKIGVGFDVTNFLITQDVEDSNIGEYTEFYSSSTGFKLVFAYKVSPRIDLNAYGRLGKLNDFDIKTGKDMRPDDISAGMTISYRLCGKEIRYKAKLEEEKKVYKLDYTK